MKQLRTGLLSTVVGLLGLTVLVTGALAADRGELVVMDLPSTGALGNAAQAGYQALQRDYDVWWLREREPQQRDRKVVAVLLNTNAPLQANLGEALADFVKKGGGVVFVVNSDREQLNANREQLASLGVKVHLGSAETVAVQVRDHPVTRGLGDLGLVRAELTLAAGENEVLATQSARPVAVAGTLGSGHFVVLLDNLVTGAEAANVNSRGTRLLVQAMNWVAGKAGTAPLTLPQEVPTTPTLPALSGSVLVDLGAGHDRWPQVRSAVEGVLDAAGLTRQAFRYVKDTGTLVQALAANPALVVVGSGRAYEEPEAAALGEYLWQGGTLLAIGYATPNTIPELQALNRLLAEAGLAVTFARAAGPAIAAPHTLTAGLQGWGQVPEGIAIWALGDEPLVNVGNSAVVATQEYGTGRIVVFDGLTLVPNPAAKTAAEDASPVFRELLARCLRWLMAERTG